MLSKVYNYLNPIAQLGGRKYSIMFPLLSTVAVILLFWANYQTKLININTAGILLILASLILVIYFSFRDAIRGGLIASSLIIAFYFYIIYSQGYTGTQKSSGIETSIALGLVYLAIASIIGWLKVTIDRLIIRQEDEKIRLRTIIQQLPVGIIITDKNGVVTQTNKSLEQILGTRLPIGFKIGHDGMSDLKINGQDIKPTSSPLFQSLKNNRSIVNRELTITTPTGKTKYVQVSSLPIHNKKGQIIAATSTIYDLTPQKELDERKDDFINMASHELKTPLTSMKLYMGSLENKIKSKDTKESSKILGNIEYQTTRIQELVNNLLDVSKLQTGKLDFRKEHLNLNELISDTVESIGLTTNKRLVFKKSGANYVYGDRFRLYQVITNLITNAIKYSTNDKDIIIKAVSTDGFVTVSVQDFGIGIPKSEQKNIFNRLYQVSDKAGQTFPGLGMGLYISKEIVTRHKGKIWVESEPEKGSTFYFKLPTQSK